MIEPAAAARPVEELVPDVRHLSLAPGTRMLITSDFHLRDHATQASTWAVTELLKVLEAWEGPGVLVFAGDLVELWAGDDPQIGTALDAHPEFVDAVSTFAAGEGRTVLYLVGNHDGRVAWDEETIGEAMTRLGCEVALTAEIDVEGVPGSTVRMEHGHSTDPANRFDDPRDPYSSPLGQHIVQEFLPSFSLVEGDWLDGVETLADPRTFPAFISSRLFYRKLAKESLWFLIPVLFILLLRLPLAYALFNGKLERLRPFSRMLFIADAMAIMMIVVGTVILVIIVRRTWRTASTLVAEERGGQQNDNTRAAGADYVREGYAGLVCGHTHHAELTALDGGFYANTGSGTKVLDRVDSHFGFPVVFLPRIQLSWVILVAGASPPWTVSLVQGRRALPGANRFERLWARDPKNLPPHPVQTGSYP
ncbi:MAG TPA: metallophosphoesterase [Actinomycetota bacterium]